MANQTAPLPQAVPFGICTRSLGRAAGGHYILELLDECAKNGLWTVEVAYECLEGYAKTLVGFNDIKDALREAARQTCRRSRELGLALTVLDAFEGYEGLIDREQHALKVVEFKFWVELCGILGVEMIQIPATYAGSSTASAEESLIVDDLREACDIGLTVIPNVKIAYEPMGWSTHVKSWERALELVIAVDRPNIGLCLDSFHLASLLSHSPETDNGLREGGQAALGSSLDRLRKIDPKHILLYQLSDAARLDPPIPLSKHTEPELDPLFAWSKHGRVFPGEGYLPVADISAAVFATGYRGPTVMETFEDDAFSPRGTLVAERAKRAVGSWVVLGRELGLAPFRAPTPKGQNKLGTCSVSIGDYKFFTLEEKMYACASAGHQAIDLFEHDFLHYLSLHPGVNKSNLWEPNPVHLAAAKRLGDLIVSLGMELICFQPLMEVEALTRQTDRDDALRRVKNYFPYMRALRTTVTYITTNTSYDLTTHSQDMNVVAADLALYADLAAEFSAADGGPMLKIGYEHLSWGSFINTFDKTWEAIELANRPNLGFVFDTFNFLAVEYANPYNPAGHGRILDTPEQSRAFVRERLAKLVKLIPGDRIYVCQVADAKLVEPSFLPAPTPSTEPWTPEHVAPIQEWSNTSRLFPNEQHLGGYMPVADCLAAIHATGHKGAYTIELFNDSIHVDSPSTVPAHATRAFVGLESCVAEAKQIEPWW